MDRDPPAHTSIKAALHTILALGLVALGCGMQSPTMGARLGGAMDLGYARRVLAEGRVPPQQALAPEAIFSEHDIPVEGPRCEQRFCARPSAVTEEQRNAVLLTVGLGSNIDRQDFRRPPLDLVVVVDRSGSMAGEKMRAARFAVRTLLSKMRPGDRVGLVQFDDASQVLSPLVPIENGLQQLQTAAESIHDAGGTCIECGLREGYALFQQVSARPGNARRLLLITDAVPNVGNTDPNGFQQMISTQANRGIELTALGLGLDFGQQLALAIGRTRGGNYVFAENAQRLQNIFSNEFDMLVTPLAYDLTMRITPSQGYRITRVFGASTAERTEETLTIRVPTVFPSNGHGAVVLRMEPTTAPNNAPTVAQMSVSYRNEFQGSEQIDRTEVTLTNTPSPAGRKVRALVAFAEGMHDSIHAHEHGDRVAAARSLTQAYSVVHSAAEELRDQELERDRTMLSNLAQAMRVTLTH